MPRDAITYFRYGAIGPELERCNDNRWGPWFQEAFQGKDDEQVLHKTRIIAKHAFAYSTLFAIFDINCYNRGGGWPNVLQRLKWHYVPWIGGTIAYTSTVMCVAALRGKTDQKNHIAGAIGAGTLVGKHVRNIYAGLVTTVILGVIGYWYKDAAMNGYEIMPEIGQGNRQHGHAYFHKTDFTTNWFAPRPGYWARSEAEVEEVMKRGQMSDGNGYRKVW